MWEAFNVADDYGIKYALSNKTVIKNTNAQELGYSSKYKTLQTFRQDTVSYNVPAGFTTKTVNHGLPYRPAFNCYFRDSQTGEIYQTEGGFEDIQFNRAGAQLNVHAKTDNQNITFVIYNSSGSSKNVDIYYEIFYQDLTTEPIQ
jgi:hypothetical protein